MAWAAAGREGTAGASTYPVGRAAGTGQAEYDLAPRHSDWLIRHTPAVSAGSTVPWTEEEEEEAAAAAAGAAPEVISVPQAGMLIFVGGGAMPASTAAATSTDAAASMLAAQIGHERAEQVSGELANIDVR